MFSRKLSLPRAVAKNHQITSDEVRKSKQREEFLLYKDLETEDQTIANKGSQKFTIQR